MKVIGTVPQQQASRVALSEESRWWIQKVFAAVQQVDWPACNAGLDASLEVMLRTLVPYCYAMGMYGSRDIEQAAAYDGAVRYLCANRWPEAGVIRRFRRRNSAVLKDVLNILLQDGEAEIRLLRAVQADSADLDE